MPFSCGVVLALFGAAAWCVLPPLVLAVLLAVMLPAYAATWVVPLLQARRTDPPIDRYPGHRQPPG